MKTITLTPTQIQVIDLMKDGYELGCQRGYNTSVWLQKGGCGKGGETAKITFGTFDALLNKGIIEPIPNQDRFSRPERFRLTVTD